MTEKPRHRRPGTRLIIAWVLFLGFSHSWGAATLCSAGEELFETRLNKGLFNTEPYSYLLIQKAGAEKPRAEEYLFAAVKYSPDLPAVYFELAGRKFPMSFNEAFESIDYFGQGIEAYKRNFWWLFSLSGLLSLSIMTSYILSLCVIVAIRFPMEFGLLSHDIREDGRKAIFLVLLVVLSFFGFFVFVGGVLFLFGLYFRPREKVIVYLALLSLLLSPAMAMFANTFLSPPSPEMRATIAVNEGRENGYALMTLGQSKDFAPAFSHALAAKREGRYEKAIGIYRSLLGKRQDALVYTNLGNVYYAANDLEAAKEAYRKAIGLESRPAANYNLSQVLRATLDFAPASEYFLAAAKLDRSAVSRFASVASSNPNRFVADELLPMSTFWEYAKEKSGVSGLSSIMAFISGLIMIPAFYLLDRRLRERAYRCKRCGAIFCNTCSRGSTWGGMCPQCYKFFIRVEELDSRERIARLMALHQSQTKRRRTARLLSTLFPGTGHIYAGRLIAGLLLLWPFLFSLAFLVLSHYPFVGLAPFQQTWAMLIAVIPAFFAYLISISHIRKGIHRGWL